MLQWLTSPSVAGTAAAVATAAVAAVGLGGFAVAHQLWLERWTDWLYYEKKVLKRRLPLGQLDKQERFVTENFVDVSRLTFPALLTLAPHFLRAVAANAVEFRLRPLDIVLSEIGIYVCFDVIYYWVHRALHDSPFLYRWIHKRHHDRLPVHVYLTAHAHYLENLLAVSPGLCIWVMINLRFISPGTFNFWNYILPATSLIMEFNTGHSGYMDHPLLYIASPLQWIIKALPTARWVAAEHEVHHLSLKKNYAPIFKLFDKMGGSHEEPAYEKFDVADVIEPRFKPRAVPIKND
ncbi:hypothetical protein HK405_005990 [Cladochytrium tenue]|nr:hypothetical protein HK405_005990 [Cladochytrium tenue]